MYNYKKQYFFLIRIYFHESKLLKTSKLNISASQKKKRFLSLQTFGANWIWTNFTIHGVSIHDSTSAHELIGSFDIIIKLISYKSFARSLYNIQHFSNPLSSPQAWHFLPLLTWVWCKKKKSFLYPLELRQYRRKKSKRKNCI